MNWSWIRSLFSKKRTAETESTSKSPSTRVRRQLPTPERIGELGEHTVNLQLAQFPRDYRSISDVLIVNPASKTRYAQLDHILVTPYGIFVIETKNYKGRIRGTRDGLHWYVNGTFKLYNPLKQNATHINSLRKALSLHEKVPFISIVCFTMRAQLDVDESIRLVTSDALVVYDVRLTDAIERKLIRLKHEQPEPLLSQVDVAAIAERIEAFNIRDPAIREEHRRSIQAARD